MTTPREFFTEKIRVPRWWYWLLILGLWVTALADILNWLAEILD